MKRLLVPLAFICCISANAQPYQSENITYLNSDGNLTKEKKAAIVRQVVQLNDTLWETNLYRKNGPRIMSLRSREATGTVFNGSYQTYRADGWEDTLGYYRDGKREGRWMVFDKTRSTFELQYEDGRLLWKKDSMEVHRERDSAAAAHKTDSTTIVEIESDYPGGVHAWLRYLNQTLRYPDEAVNNNIMGMVVVEFIVDKDGSIQPTSLWVRGSEAISLDREALRVISQSGTWVPAVRSGKNVKSYKLQPIVFRLERR